MRAFLDCPQCWYRSRILGEPGRIGISLPIGNAVHEGMAHARRRAAASAELNEEAVAIAADTLEREIARVEPGLLDFEVTASDPGVAKDLVVRLVGRGIERLIPEELKRGYVEIEARPDFGPLFPFTVDGYTDVILAGPILLFKDLKTSKDKREPDAFAKMQLRLYTLPWHAAGQEVQMQIDTLTKSGPVPVFHTAVESNGDGYQGVREWVLQTAGAISDAMESGDFPAHPGRFCDYPHPMAA